jgi:hypothetical protein
MFPSLSAVSNYLKLQSSLEEQLGQMKPNFKLRFKNEAEPTWVGDTVYSMGLKGKI